MPLNDLESSRFDINYQQQAEFNEKAIYALDRFKANLKLLSDQQNSTTTHDGKQDGDIARLQQTATDLQNSLKQLNTSFSSLQSDNGTFKSNVNQTVSDFHSILDTFQGQLTANSSLSNQNATDISQLKTQFDPKRWSTLLNGLDNLPNVVDTEYHRLMDSSVNAMSQDLIGRFNDLSTQVSSQLSETNTGLNNKVSQALNNNQDTSNRVSDLSSTVTSGLQNAQNAIQAEQTRAEQKEGNLQNSLNTLQTSVTSNTDAISAEVANRVNAEAENLQSAKDYADKGDASVSSQMENRIVTSQQQAIDTANAFTNSLTSGLLSKANSYTDDQTKAARNVAETAVDNATAAQNVAKSAQDSANNATNLAQSADDLAVGSAKASQTMTEGLNKAAPNIPLASIDTSLSGASYNDDSISISTGSFNNMQITVKNGFSFGFTGEIGDKPGVMSNATSFLGNGTVQVGHGIAIVVLSQKGLDIYVFVNNKGEIANGVHFNVGDKSLSSIIDFSTIIGTLKALLIRNSETP